MKKIDPCVLERVFVGFTVLSIDQSKTFTLLLKSKILDFETLSRVHLYRIEYVSYRQGPIEYVSIRLTTVSSQP